MGSLSVPSLVVRRHANDKPYNEQASLLLCEEHFWTDSKIQKNFRGFGDYWSGVMAVLMYERLGGYLYDESGNIQAIAVYPRQFDIHYGMVAVPILVIVKTEHRGEVSVSRQVSRLIKHMVQELNADKYLVCQHINDTTQIHKLRYLNGRS